MKVFVTGATGFIGGNLARRLTGEGFEVICSGRSLSKLGSLSDKAKPVYLDIEDKEAVGRILSQERPEALFHCAAEVRNYSLKRLRLTNVEGTRNVLEACLREGVKRVIYLSTTAVISGNNRPHLTEDLPYKAMNRYGESKIEAEKIALYYREKGLKIAILRAPFVYGEHEPHALPLLSNLIRRRFLPILGDGRNRLHLVGVENLVDVLVLSLRDEAACDGIYTVADKEILSMKEVFGYIAEVLQAKPPLRIPQAFIPFLIRIPFVGKNVSFFIKDRAYNIERLRKVLGYTPRVSIYEGLKKAVLSYFISLDKMRKNAKISV